VPRKTNIQIYNNQGVLEECMGSFQERFRESYLLEKKDFFQCIINGAKPKCGAKDGTAATRVAYAANKAYQTGEVVKVQYGA
jgi:myo-inositol 2-dehydrogenase/D-chiro-inositol 1-dehydrogenase